MQVTQTLSEGLKREFTIVLPANRLTQATEQKLQSYAQRVKVPGFRPGKVPMPVLRQRYLNDAHAEALDVLLQESAQKVMNDNNITPALRPGVSVKKYEPEQTLEYILTVESMPTIPNVSLPDISLQKPEITLDDAHVDEALEAIRKRHERFAESDKAAKQGDKLQINFLGKQNGVPFDGGKAEEFEIVIGSKRLIPGFEDQLVGLKAGDEKVITVTFPEDYSQASLAGKEATFDITCLKVETAQDIALDDQLAKDLGRDSLEDLRTAVREQLASEYTTTARGRMKRDLLDHLDKHFTFDLPPSLVEQETKAIVEQMKREAAADDEDMEPGHVHDENCGHNHKPLPEDEELYNKCKPLAERRVKLGLILAQAGKLNAVTVSEEEVRRAIFEKAITMGGNQAGMILKFFSENPDAIEAVKAPLFEDKVVDFMLDKVTTTARPVTREAFQEEMKALEKEDIEMVGLGD
jgi:trigger factor